MSRQRHSAAPLPGWLLLAAGFIAAALVKPVQDRIRPLVAEPLTDPDILYFASPAAVKKMSLGYESLLADVYWIRTIQYYGRREEADRRAVRYKNLPSLLDITTTLDPNMIEVYRTGSYFLSEPEPVGAGLPEEAGKLLAKGIRHHPEQWRLFFELGFVHFIYMQDYKRAGEIWLRAVGLPDVPEWMEPLAAKALSQGGAVETAKALWEQQYRESERDDVRRNARNHLDSIQVDEDLWTMEFLVGMYKERTGGPPASIQDLVRAGLLRFVPSDPSGRPYHYDPATGRVSLSTASPVRRFEVPDDYRIIFLEKLAQRLTPN